MKKWRMIALVLYMWLAGMSLAWLFVFSQVTQGRMFTVWEPNATILWFEIVSSVMIAGLALLMALREASALDKRRFWRWKRRR